MCYVVVDSAEFTYPDQLNYPSANSEIILDAARGGYATFQILIDGLKADHKKEN